MYRTSCKKVTIAIEVGAFVLVPEEGCVSTVLCADRDSLSVSPIEPWYSGSQHQARGDKGNLIETQDMTP